MSFNQLPSELLIKIFNLLPLKDKIKCRRLSKKYLNLFDNKLLSKTLVIDKEKNFRREKWLDNNQIIGNCDLVLKRDNVKLFKNNLYNSRYLANLKKLYISCYIMDQDKCNRFIGIIHQDRCNCFGFKDLNFLNDNNFKQLETLYLLISNLRKVNNIKLSNLKNLEVCSSILYKLNFDTINLNYLIYYDKSNLSFVFNYIEHIKICCNDLIDLFSLTNFQMKKLDVCLNDFLIIRYLPDLINFTKRLRYLEELHLIFESKKELDLSKLNNYNLNQNKSLKIYINGLLINNSINKENWNQLKNLFKSSKLLDNDKLKIYIKNNLLIQNNLSFIEKIDYKSFENQYLKNKISDNLIDKLTNLSKITINDKVNSFDCLLKLINKFNNILSIVLINSSLNEEFYNKYLTYYQPFIQYLIIHDNNDLINKFNFNFLFKFKLIELIYVNYQFDLSFIEKLFMNLNELILINFIYNKQFVKIRIIQSSDFYSDKYLRELQDNHYLRNFIRLLSDNYNRKWNNNHKYKFIFEKSNQIN